jgi:hypothetical protein
MIIETQCTSGRTLDTASDSDWQLFRKTLLTENGAESGKMHNMKVIENFKTFIENINISSYDQWFRSYDHCKLGRCWKFLVSVQSSYLGKLGL